MQMHKRIANLERMQENRYKKGGGEGKQTNGSWSILIEMISSDILKIEN